MCDDKIFLLLMGINTGLGYENISDVGTQGISYMVRGLCSSSGVGVTGDIIGSHIYDLSSGPFSRGHQGGNWSFNEVMIGVLFFICLRSIYYFGVCVSGIPFGVFLRAFF